MSVAVGIIKPKARVSWVTTNLKEAGGKHSSHSGANACVLTAIGASLNLEEETWPVDPVQTEILDMLRHPRQTLQLQIPILEHKSTHAIIIALGIEFLHEMGRRYQPVDKKYYTLAVVKVFPADKG